MSVLVDLLAAGFAAWIGSRYWRTKGSPQRLSGATAPYVALLAAIVWLAGLIAVTANVQAPCVALQACRGLGLGEGPCFDICMIHGDAVTYAAYSPARLTSLLPLFAACIFLVFQCLGLLKHSFRQGAMLLGCASLGVAIANLGLYGMLRDRVACHNEAVGYWMDPGFSFNGPPLCARQLYSSTHQSRGESDADSSRL